MNALPNHITPADIAIRPTSAAYAQQLIALVYAGYHGDPAVDQYEDASAERFIRHTELFPQGQFMAVHTPTDRVVGLTTSMIIDFDPARPLLESWNETTADGWLTTHNPRGGWMYGVESIVHPDVQGCGIGSRLMDARFNSLRALNLRGMVAGSLFIDYHKHAETYTVEGYIDAVKAGQVFDTNLTKQLHKGFRVHNLIPNYIHEPRTNDYAAAIMWLNPAWQQTVRPAA